jgi:hypothetical protein
MHLCTFGLCIWLHSFGGYAAQQAAIYIVVLLGFFYVLGGLVIHDIDLGLEAFDGNYIQLFLLCFEDAYIVHFRDRGD